MMRGINDAVLTSLSKLHLMLNALQLFANAP